MALTPFYKPSGDEVRDMVRRNRENGEIEEGFETAKKPNSVQCGGQFFESYR
jgi:hypothetical protein